jgi:hypothetical protein
MERRALVWIKSEKGKAPVSAPKSRKPLTTASGTCFDARSCSNDFHSAGTAFRFAPRVAERFLTMFAHVTFNTRENQM